MLGEALVDSETETRWRDLPSFFSFFLSFFCSMFSFADFVLFFFIAFILLSHYIFIEEFLTNIFNFLKCQIGGT